MRGLESVANVTEAGIERVLDLAQDVPYNVQLLAHVCWETAQASDQRPRLTAEFVANANDAAARGYDPIYSQRWATLTSAQQKALLAFVYERGEALSSARVAQRFRLPVSTLQKALEALVDKQILREEAAAGRVRLRLEDPLFGSWVEQVVAPMA